MIKIEYKRNKVKGDDPRGPRMPRGVPAREGRGMVGTWGGVDPCWVGGDTQANVTQGLTHNYDGIRVDKCDNRNNFTSMKTNSSLCQCLC